MSDKNNLKSSFSTKSKRLNKLGLSMYGDKERSLNNKYQFYSTLGMVTTLIIYIVFQNVNENIISYSAFFYLFLYLVVTPINYVILRYFSNSVDFGESLIHNSIAMSGILVFYLSVIMLITKVVFNFDFEIMLIDIMNVMVWLILKLIRSNIKIVED